MKKEANNISHLLCLKVMLIENSCGASTDINSTSQQLGLVVIVIVFRYKLKNISGINIPVDEVIIVHYFPM